MIRAGSNHGIDVLRRCRAVLASIALLLTVPGCGGVEDAFTLAIRGSSESEQASPTAPTKPSQSAATGEGD